MNLEAFIMASQVLPQYKQVETIAKLAERLGIDKTLILKLNANENLFIPLEKIRSILSDVIQELDPRYYPDSERTQLEAAIGKKLKTEAGQVVIGSGGDQIIDLILSSFLKEGEGVLTVTPTFSMYKQTATLKRLEYQTVDLEPDFTLDPKKIIKSVKRNTGLLVICNPNNPTGNQFNKEAILEVITSFDGIVLIDEAYSEFGRYSLVDKVEEFKNLIVLKTFSKAYGLAGMRLGYALSNKVLANLLNERYQAPYPVSQVALMTGIKLLETDVEKIVEDIKRERKWLTESLNKIEGIKAFPSDTNFVLFNTKKPYQKVYDSLLEKGIIVRKIGKVPGYSDCLRVTVAPREIGQQFINALQEVMK